MDVLLEWKGTFSLNCEGHHAGVSLLDSSLSENILKGMMVLITVELPRNLSELRFC